MEKRTRTPADTVQFVKEAVLEGAHKRTPEGIKPTNWGNMRNVGGTYYLHPSATLEEIGQKYGVTREWIRQTKDKFLARIHQNASDDLKAKYPLDELSKEKPLSIKSRQRISQSLGGAGTVVAARYQEGMSYEDLRNETGLDARRLSGARKTLKNWGREIPRKGRVRAEKIAELLKKITESQSFEEKQTLIEGVDVSLHNFGTTGNGREFIPVYPLLKSIGFHVRPQEIQCFVDTLKTAGIPVGEIPGRVQYKGKPSRNLFIVKSDIEEARQMLMGNQELKDRFANQIR